MPAIAVTPGRSRTRPRHREATGVSTPDAAAESRAHGADDSLLSPLPHSDEFVAIGRPPEEDRLPDAAAA
eukprot:1380804-Pyramimonas_sp.AAC.1